MHVEMADDQLVKLKAGRRDFEGDLQEYLSRQ